MDEYIKKEAALRAIERYGTTNGSSIGHHSGAIDCAICEIERLPVADVVEVVRCKDCIFYHKEHVLCNDGTEKDISEFPPEAFGTFGIGVTMEYGINVGGKCEIDKHSGYGVDKSVFRSKQDFCSRGIRRKQNDIG